jgi:hypothetical protein
MQVGLLRKSEIGVERKEDGAIGGEGELICRAEDPMLGMTSCGTLLCMTHNLSYGRLVYHGGV